MLRPFFGRPSQQAVPFVRKREGSFADAVMQSSKSALGIYRQVEQSSSDRWKASDAAAAASGKALRAEAAGEEP
jgi:hypothetical protein